MTTNLFKVALGIAALSLPFAAQAGPGDWAFDKVIDTPINSGSTLPTIGVQRLTADSTGKVFVSVNAGSPHQYIYTIADVNATTLTYNLLLQDAAMANGFQGLVVDENDNFYVAGESGTVGTGSLRKYDAAGALVTSFGDNGTTAPTARITGLGLLSNGTLVATTFGGNFYTFDASTGAETNALNANPAGNYVRDIAVKPDTSAGEDILFINKSGDLKKVTGGNVNSVTSYTLVQDWGTGITNIDTTFNVRAGVGYFAKDDTVIYTNQKDNKVYVVDGSTGALVQTLGTGTVDASAVPANGELVQPSDVALFTKDEVDYMVICMAIGKLSIWKKSEVATVKDWTLLD